MRILIVCYVYPPEAAPAGVMVRELAEELSTHGHDVTVLTGWPRGEDGTLIPGIAPRWRAISRDGAFRLMRLRYASRTTRSAPRRLWSYTSFAGTSFVNGLTLGQQDVVVSLSTPLTGVWTAWCMARLWRARFINVIFDLWPEAIRNSGLIGDTLVYRLLRHIDTLNCKWSDAVTTLGDGLKEQIIARGVRPSSVHVIPFWIDVHKVRPLPRMNAWRLEQGIPSDVFVALFAGTIGYVSGAHILAQTAQALTKRQDILILVVGEGVVKDELQKAAQDLGLTNIRFLPFQPAERLAEMQSAADVGLVTLRPESGLSSVPSKILGYMSAGKPVIASVPDNTDTSRLLRAADCGLVVESQNAAALASAIQELADDPSRCHRLGASARTFTVAHFSRETVVRRYEDLILDRNAAIDGARL
jgi:colanic acid biosynthesis glycosyl transferase WcaI